MEDKNEYITLTNLKNRGWTDSIIKKMNMLPDKQARNTHSSRAPPTKLYKVVRIEKLEKSEQFINLIFKSQPRKEAAKKAVGTKIAKLFAYVDNLTIEVEYIPEPELTYCAVNVYNSCQVNKSFTLDNTGNCATIHSDEIFLNRIRLNFIRHNLTNYDSILAEIEGKVGISEVYPELKKRVMARIDAEWKLRCSLSKETLGRTEIEQC